MGNNLTIDELQSAVFSISDKIKEIERKTGFDKYGDILAAPQIAEKLFTPDGGEMIIEISNALDYLHKAGEILERLKREPMPPEKLHKNTRGRYATSTKEYTSGNTIEFLRVIDTGTEDTPPITRWCFARVEYDGARQDYYIAGHKAVELEGLTVRERGAEEEPANDQKHYEESPEGQRFIKSIENAKKFTLKHSNGGLLFTQLNYLANKHCNSLLNGNFDLTALAYRRGYMDGKAAAKIRNERGRE